MIVIAFAEKNENIFCRFQKSLICRHWIVSRYNKLVEGIVQGETPFGGKFMRVKSVTGVPSEGLKLSTRVRETLR